MLRGVGVEAPNVPKLWELGAAVFNYVLASHGTQQGQTHTPNLEPRDLTYILFIQLVLRLLVLLF